MNVLLDTHVFIWAINKPERLTKSDYRYLQNPKNRIFVSAASLWEISFLLESRPGELKVTTELSDFIASGLETLNAEILPILPSHAQRHFEIQPAEGHSDLFDRMILAQAASENLLLLSYDRQFPKYQMVRLAL